jgi:hypothetical protein
MYKKRYISSLFRNLEHEFDEKEKEGRKRKEKGV